MENGSRKVILLVSFCLLSCPLLAQSEHNNLQLRIEPSYFSPNKDAVQDQVFFYPVLQSNSEITRWRLDIMTPGHKKVARLSGAGLPALIKWDGSDKKGNPVADGPYVAQLEVVGHAHCFSAGQSLVVDTHPPLVSLALSTSVLDKTLLGNGSLHLTPAISDESPLDRWLLQIVDVNGRTVQVFWSSGPAHELLWDGTDRTTKVLVPRGSYRCVLQAWDKAGNESQPAFADLSVNVSAREMLEQALHRIQVNETALGLIVQLRRDDLFLVRRKELILSDDGRDLLREVSILINAYPDVPVKLDGYSKAKKNSPKDRNLASVHAWKVYSYLIKFGNVQASRLTVRGRGRSAMFGRRSVAIPLIRNGVEVILEGNRQW